MPSEVPAVIRTRSGETGKPRRAPFRRRRPRAPAGCPATARSRWRRRAWPSSTASTSAGGVWNPKGIGSPMFRYRTVLPGRFDGSGLGDDVPDGVGEAGAPGRPPECWWGLSWPWRASYPRATKLSRNLGRISYMMTSASCRKLPEVPHDHPPGPYRNFPLKPENLTACSILAGSLIWTTTSWV